MNVKITHPAQIRRNRLRHSRASQNGSALAIAVFIIVVMAVLAAGITKSISSSSDQVVYEVLGTRALFAAESANERMLAKIFPLNVISNPSVCPEIGTVPMPAPENINFPNSGASSIDGLQNCVASTRCFLKNTGGAEYYQIVSTGVCKATLNGDFSCGNEKVCASRTIEVEAKAL